MLKLIKHHNKPSTYKSFETGIEYDEFKGGFSWPINGGHGYMCVVGMETVSKRLRIGAEYTENAFDAMASRLKTIAKFYHVPYWVAPTDGDYKSYYDTLHKIAGKKGYELICSAPSLVDDLQLSAHLLNSEINGNSILLPENGILIAAVKNMRMLDIDDHSKLSKVQPIIVVAGVIFEFPSLEDRTEKKTARDAYAIADDKPKCEHWLGM